MEDLFCPFSETTRGRMGTFQSVFSGYYWSGYYPLGNFLVLNHVDYFNVSNYLAVKQWKKFLISYFYHNRNEKWGFLYLFLFFFFLSPLSCGSHDTVEKFGFLSEVWWTKKVASHRTLVTSSVHFGDLARSLLKQAGDSCAVLLFLREIE